MLCRESEVATELRLGKTAMLSPNKGLYEREAAKLHLKGAAVLT